MTTRVLLDTNVVLDVLLDRQPFVDEARRLWEASDEGLFDACIASFTIPTIYYVCGSKPVPKRQAVRSICAWKRSRSPRFTGNACWRRGACLAATSRTTFRSPRPSRISCRALSPAIPPTLRRRQSGSTRPLSFSRRFERRRHPRRPRRKLRGRVVAVMSDLKSHSSEQPSRWVSTTDERWAGPALEVTGPW
jgi:predicted nucleic acid-binding protein